jgi:toxin ParE1/3/4
MARIELLPDVFEDLDRIFDHLAKHDTDGTPGRIAEILAAIDVLASNPEIGRPARDDRRELVIGAGSRGYVALYVYVPELDAVFVLALRAQKEAGYKHV